MAINPIVREHFSLPEWALCDERFKGLASEEIYERLPKVRVKMGRDGSFEITMPGGKKIRGRLVDDHRVWDQASGGSGGKSAERLAEEWKMRVVQAAQAAKAQGNLPGGIERLVEDLLYPRLPWRQLLHHYVNAHRGGTYDWTRPSRRFAHFGVFYPRRRTKELNAAVAIDTSGSISEEELQSFLSETRGILASFKRFNARLLACDADVHTDVSAATLADFDRFKVRVGGGGGTSYTPVFDRLKNSKTPVQVLVYLTDGYCDDAPKNAPFDVIWVISKEGTDQNLTDRVGRLVEMKQRAAR